MNKTAEDVVLQEGGFSLAELLIVAASEAWRGNGEVLASGIGVVPRLGASLAKLTHSPELLMTDSESFLVEDPIPIGPRGDFKPRYSGYMSFDRVFECVWGGRRHAMIGPTQIDRFGQTNLSVVGDYAKPKSAILGVRGLPGNSINHANSFFVPNHSKRVFVSGEVDMVSGVGYNPGRWPEGSKSDYVDLRLVITDLCVMDFGGENHACRVRALHPGVTFEQVQEATGFELVMANSCAETAAPTSGQLEIIRKLDPYNLRSTVIKNNPPGIRTA
ncbi:glutaconate CoA-transferase subunit B [Paraburkholderia sp. BL18I3N2]|uniref:CoA-transferase subunit beta n=1 Tax=Paraburkholderia sp. BL18I3N2 TaxID=1938799 RepID=UPI000D048C55|nr:ketoacid CoA transferase [Paraburkholderia sp. BL18I3N2]PRX27363.1 glutaconate CoA-transferase subunit B [Paraburkholderia sp. BL18I3N2]